MSPKEKIEFESVVLQFYSEDPNEIRTPFEKGETKKRLLVMT